MEFSVDKYFKFDNLEGNQEPFCSFSAANYAASWALFENRTGDVNATEGFVGAPYWQNLLVDKQTFPPEDCAQRCLLNIWDKRCHGFASLGPTDCYFLNFGSSGSSSSSANVADDEVYLIRNDIGIPVFRNFENKTLYDLLRFWRSIADKHGE